MKIGRDAYVVFGNTATQRPIEYLIRLVHTRWQLTFSPEPSRRAREFSLTRILLEEKR